MKLILNYAQNWFGASTCIHCWFSFAFSPATVEVETETETETEKKVYIKSYRYLLTTSNIENSRNNMNAKSSSSKSTNTSSTKVNSPKEKKRPCCVCKETRAARDLCVAEFGPDHLNCIKLIEAHKQCLRDEGFKVN